MTHNNVIAELIRFITALKSSFKKCYTVKGYKLATQQCINNHPELSLETKNGLMNWLNKKESEFIKSICVTTAIYRALYLRFANNQINVQEDIGTRFATIGSFVNDNFNTYELITNEQINNATDIMKFNVYVFVMNSTFEDVDELLNEIRHEINTE